MGEKERLLLTSSKLESVILELFSDQSLCLWNMRLQIYPVHQLHQDPSLRNDANHHHDLILIFFHGFSNDTDAWVKAWIQRDDHHVCCWPLETGYPKRKKRRRDWVIIFWCCLCPSTLIPVAHTRKSVKEPTAEPGE